MFLRIGLRSLRSGHWPSLLGAWLHFELSCMVWLLIGALGVVIAEEFSLSATQKGFLVAVPLLGGSVLRIVVGPLADQFGAKNIGLAILLLEGLALLFGWLFGTSYFHMLGIGLLLGFAGASFAIALPIASQAYPPAHQGLAMGMAAVGNSGIVLATFFAPRLAEIVGWHSTFGLMVVPTLVATLAFYWLVSDKPRFVDDRTKVGLLQSLGSILQQPLMYWLSFLYAVTFGGFVGLSSFLPIFFYDQYRLDVVAAGTVTSLCVLAGSVARPIGGHLADIYGGTRLIKWLLPIIAVLSFVISSLLPPGVAFPLTITILLLLGFGNGVVFQMVSLRYYGLMGTASGLIGAAGGLGGFLLASWFGLLKDLTGTYASGFLIFGLLSGIATLSTVLFQRFLESPAKRLPERG